MLSLTSLAIYRFRKNKNTNFESLVPKLNKLLHFSDPKQRGIHSESAWDNQRFRGGSVPPRILTLFCKTHFSLWYIEIYERSLKETKKVTFLLSVIQVSNGQNSCCPGWYTKTHILKDWVQTQEGQLTQGGKEDVLTITEAVIKDQCSHNMSGRRWCNVQALQIENKIETFLWIYQKKNTLRISYKNYIKISPQIYNVSIPSKFNN